MKALTIRQPWAMLVIMGLKPVECRRKPITYRGRLAIHAGAAVPDTATVQAAWAFLGRSGTFTQVFEEWCLYTLPRGVVLGTVEVAGCELLAAPTPWGDWAWHLADPREWATQEHARGQLGLWDLDEGITAAAEFAAVRNGRLSPAEMRAAYEAWAHYDVA